MCVLYKYIIPSLNSGGGSSRRRHGRTLALCLRRLQVAAQPPLQARDLSSQIEQLRATQVERGSLCGGHQVALLGAIGLQVVELQWPPVSCMMLIDLIIVPRVCRAALAIGFMRGA